MEDIWLKCSFCIKESPSVPSLSRFLEIVVVSGDGDASLKVHHLQLQLQMGDCSRNGFLGIPGSSGLRMYPMKLVNIWGNNVPKNPPPQPFQRRTLLSCGILPSVETSLVGPPPPGVVGVIRYRRLVCTWFWIYVITKIRHIFQILITTSSMMETIVCCVESLLEHLELSEWRSSVSLIYKHTH